MQIGTAVFRRIIEENRQSERSAAIKALCATMAETVRFGSFVPEIQYEIAKDRIDSWKDDKRGW